MNRILSVRSTDVGEGTIQITVQSQVRTDADAKEEPKEVA